MTALSRRVLLMLLAAGLPAPLAARWCDRGSLTPEQRAVVEWTAKVDGCSITDFTDQEINLIIHQAEMMGDLP
jgi:hypothetical protein